MSRTRSSRTRGIRRHCTRRISTTNRIRRGVDKAYAQVYHTRCHWICETLHPPHQLQCYTITTTGKVWVAGTIRYTTTGSRSHLLSRQGRIAFWWSQQLCSHHHNTTTATTTRMEHHLRWYWYSWTYTITGLYPYRTKNSYQRRLELPSKLCSPGWHTNCGIAYQHNQKCTNYQS